MWRFGKEGGRPEESRHNVRRDQGDRAFGMMRSRVPVALFLAIVLTHLAGAAPALPNINTNNVFTVTNAAYGAIGDGVFTNTVPIQNAINAAAAASGGGTVEIPAPGVYLCGPLALKSYVNLQIDAGAVLQMLPYDEYPGGIINPPDFITGSSLHDIALTGGGAIDGQGAPWWPGYKTNNRPVMVVLGSCTRVLLQSLTLSNSPAQFISIKGNNAGNVTIQGITVKAPPSSGVAFPSHNTDAIDLAETNALVQNCYLDTGDDNIAIGSSGGVSRDILVTNCFFGEGHGCSIGSYTSSGVSNLTVINCTFNNTDNGIRIKSDNDRGGIVQNCNYLNLTMTNVNFPFCIYGYYNSVGTPSSISPVQAATQTVATVTSKTPIYRNLTFSNITATSITGYPVGLVWARTEMPATNLVFNRVNLNGDRNFCLYNVSGAQFIDCDINTSTYSNTFVLFDAQVIITNSAPTNNLFAFDGLTTNGYGNSLQFYNALGSLRNTNALDDGPLTLSASTFRVSNNLALFPASVLNFVPGTNSTTLAVVGVLSLGGTVNIAAGPGFTNGIYTLMTYSSALSGDVPALGSVPPGYNFSFNTNTAGQVKLVAISTAPVPPSPPANLIATPSNALVTLSWALSLTATNYNVKRSTVSGGPYALLGTTLSANYADSQVTNGSSYFYVVSGVNAYGEGANSVEAGATPQAPLTNVITTTVLYDGFAGSSLNSTTPLAPTATNTAYEIVSSKAWNPLPTIAAGHLKFGIVPTTSGSIETQALFTNSPVTLASIGDSISLMITFTNTSGLLTQSGALGFGLYASGQSFPVPGGLNGTATGGSTGYANGYAQNWVGYVGQLAFTGTSSQILTRAAQTGTANNNQDTVTSGSSSSYNSPPGATVGAASSAASETLTAGSPYTEVLTITLAGANSLAITNNLYSGTDTNGVLLSQFGGVASGGTYLTNRFDALAIGWRATANTFATAIDINSITVQTSLATPVQPVSLVPTNIVCQAVGNQLQVSWPADHTGWRLQCQTNSFASRLSTNWVALPNSQLTNQWFLPIDPGNNSVFLRLIYP